jgi:HEAT repeat protein
MEPMEILLDHPDEKLGEKLLPLLKKLRGERSSNIFLKMSEHPSEMVRKEAVQVLLARNPQVILKLFHLVGDPSPEIRTMILKGIGKQKSPILENLLLKHINENLNNKDNDYIIACYCALGRCGSNKTLPYLSRILLDKGWKRFIGLDKSVHREGAATALALLGGQQAEQILHNASKSKIQVIRDAYQKAITRRETYGETTNG